MQLDHSGSRVTLSSLMSQCIIVKVIPRGKYKSLNYRCFVTLWATPGFSVQEKSEYVSMSITLMIDVSTKITGCSLLF